MTQKTAITPMYIHARLAGRLRNISLFIAQPSRYPIGERVMVGVDASRALGTKCNVDPIERDDAIAIPVPGTGDDLTRLYSSSVTRISSVPNYIIVLQGTLTRPAIRPKRGERPLPALQGTFAAQHSPLGAIGEIE